MQAAACGAFALVVLLVGAVPASAGLGDFKVAIWNSQGSGEGLKWQSVLNFLQQGYDVVLIQEAGASVGTRSNETWPNPDDATRPLTRYTWSAGGSVYNIYHLEATKNLAIVTPYTALNAVVLPAPDNNNGSAATRGIPGVQLQNPFVAGSTPTWFFSAHASSFGPNNAYNNAEGIINAVNAQGYTSWAVGGDFNRDLQGPSQFWPTLPSSDVTGYHSNQATQQSGGELDYLFSNDEVYGEAAKRMANPGSDHWPVCFEFDLAAAGYGGGPGPDDHDAAAACVTSNSSGFWGRAGSCVGAAVLTVGAVYSAGADAPLLMPAAAGCVGGIFAKNVTSTASMVSCISTSTHGHDFTGHHRRLEENIWSRLEDDPELSVVYRPNLLQAYHHAANGVTFWEHDDYDISKLSIDVMAAAGSGRLEAALYYDILKDGIHPLPETRALAQQFDVDVSAELEWARLKLGSVLATHEGRTRCGSSGSLACNELGAAYCFLSANSTEICKWMHDTQAECKTSGGSWKTPGSSFDINQQTNLTQAECLRTRSGAASSCNSDCVAAGAHYCFVTGDGTEACGWHARTEFFCSGAYFDNHPGTRAQWITPGSAWDQTHQANLTEAACLSELLPKNCDSSFPCEFAEGHCESSAECASGLTCASGVGTAYGFDSSVSVCLLNSQPSCSTSSPCGLGQGDCVEGQNASCGNGLYCAGNIGRLFGYSGSWVDVCLADTAGGDCSTGQPCGLGRGHCDSDAECGEALQCVAGVGDRYGYASTVSVCLRAQAEHRECSATNPCIARHGDCDSNSECESGLTCWHDIGQWYGHANNAVDVCIRDCSSSSPCGALEGHCTSTSECESGLTCVAGAGQYHGYHSAVGVCLANSYPLYTASNPGPFGVADCVQTDNASCLDALVCSPDVGHQFGYQNSLVDVCVAAGP